MLEFTKFTKKEIDKILAECSFNEIQLKIFNLLLDDKYNDIGIILNLDISHNKYYKIKRIIRDKINRVLLGK